MISRSSFVPVCVSSLNARVLSVRSSDPLSVCLGGGAATNLTPGLNRAGGHSIIVHLMIEAPMPTVVTINGPDAINLIEMAANRLTGGNKTEAVAMAMRHLLERDVRAGSLFGTHPGSVRVRDGVDLTAPVLEDPTDAATGHEIDR